MASSNLSGVAEIDDYRRRRGGRAWGKGVDSINFSLNLIQSEITYVLSNVVSLHCFIHRWIAPVHQNIPNNDIRCLSNP